MAKWPNHFISGKQFQKGQIWLIGLFKGQMATLKLKTIGGYLLNAIISQSFWVVIIM